jgi:membrane protein required for colicin V production
MGLFFGIVRGGIMLVMLTLLAGLTALPRSPAWHDSMVGAPAVEAAKKVIPWLPHELAVLIRFN